MAESFAVKHFRRSLEGRCAWSPRQKAAPTARVGAGWEGEIKEFRRGDLALSRRH